MNDDRQWFVSLQPEYQAIVLLELLATAGGPVLWQVLKRAQKIYDRYREHEIDNLKESMVVVQTPSDSKTNAKTTQPVEQVIATRIKNKAKLEK
ncbi:unnamed protein product, partial [Iphiclides podalirius]